MKNPSLRSPGVDLIRFVVPLVSLAGALTGLWLGVANGTVAAGVVSGGVIGGALGWALPALAPSRLVGRAAAALLLGLAGLALAGIPGLGGGLILGLVVGWFTYFLSTGAYRRGVPVYATSLQVLWFNSFLLICGLIFFFLIAPIVVIMPLSFNAQDFFTFTPAMLAMDPEGFSIKHYRDFFTNPGLAAATAEFHPDCSGGDSDFRVAGHARRDRAERRPRALPPHDHGHPDLPDDRAAHHLRGGNVFLLLADRPPGDVFRGGPRPMSAKLR